MSEKVATRFLGNNSYMRVCQHCKRNLPPHNLTYVVEMMLYCSDSCAEKHIPILGVVV